MPSYEAGVNRLPEEVSFGVTTIRIARASGLKKLQVGYSTDPRGVPLSGEAEGDWKSYWLVIGEDDTSGDPLFIDTSQGGFPVYTAFHGQGSWKPTLIAASLEGFGRALNILLELARGREDPMSLQSNPVTLDERVLALSKIREQNPSADMEFWTALMDAS